MAHAQETAVLTPGRMPLSMALAGMSRSLSARSLIEHAASLGFRAVQLDAAHPDLRPRDLTRSARRDLAARLRRSNLTCSGVDLWAPPHHLTDPAHADHAIDAFSQAITFAAEMAALTGGPTILSTSLPLPDQAGAVQQALHQFTEVAQSCGASIADHTWTTDGHAQRHAPRGAPVGVGLDPASILLAGADPARAASRLGAADSAGILAARLSDADGAARVAPGLPSGRLDAFAYAIALHAAGYHHHVVLDLRGVPDPLTTLGAIRERFDASP